MEKIKNPGFRKETPETGLRAIANPYPGTDITWGREGVVGRISPPSARALGGSDTWGIRFIVEKEPTVEDPCDWKWVALKKTFETEPEARAWVRENWAAINEKLKLKQIPRDD